LGDIPAARASAEMPATKVLKSPPQRAAKEGVERKSVAKRRTVRRRGSMGNHSHERRET
jgi:hypothetical protein